MKKIASLMVFLLMAVCSVTASHAVPNEMNFQGHLTDSGGVPIDRTVNMTFSIYDAETGGSPLWTDTIAVEVSNGIYSVVLGEATPLNLDFDGQYWFGIEVETDGEMQPRLKLSSAPYAMRAEAADSVPANSISGTAIVDGSITYAKLAPGMVPCNPGDFVNCYTGPSGSAATGTCQSGIRTCSGQGQYGECEGEITPAPEVCGDGLDNDCDGQADEHVYCNTDKTCCSWVNQPGYDTCVSLYVASVSANPPDGDLTLLPCVSPASASDPQYALCYNPGEVCDGIDNNCDGQIDEGMVKCGNPLHCPETEVCNGQDDNCDGQVDEGGGCGACTWSPEVCDGCDNDCDGIADNNIYEVQNCGLVYPANCAGTQACLPSQVVGSPGACASSNYGWGACSNNPQPETCDGMDNDCDGVTDEGC